MKKITLYCHTGQVEVFHSMLLQYCPKRTYFPHDAMKACLMAAALDWNGQVREEVKDADVLPILRSAVKTAVSHGSLP